MTTIPRTNLNPMAESESDEDKDDFESDDESESEPIPATQAAASLTPATSTGSRILTLEAARDFVNSCGILLFGPRPLGAPAPSLVEATLGAAKSSVTAAESETARSLVARLVAEGSAVPLNLLGGPGDVPDFIVSTAAFPFVFTLRGDKGWKRAPETSGAVKVTTLALHVYEVLTEKGALTVAEIVNEVGREITESAVIRALSELWALVRVIPSLGQGEGAHPLGAHHRPLPKGRKSRRQRRPAHRSQRSDLPLSRPGIPRHRRRNLRLPFPAHRPLPRA